MRRVAWVVAASIALVAALFLFVFPTRTYVAQQKELAATEARVRVLTEQNQQLAARVQQLHTDEEIERLAREQYNLVRPGEEAYAILPAPGTEPRTPAVTSAPPPAARRSDDRNWLRRAADFVTFWD